MANSFLRCLWCWAEVPEPFWKWHKYLSSWPRDQNEHSCGLLIKYGRFTSSELVSWVYQKIHEYWTSLWREIKWADFWMQSGESYLHESLQQLVLRPEHQLLQQLHRPVLLPQHRQPLHVLLPFLFLFLGVKLRWSSPLLGRFSSVRHRQLDKVHGLHVCWPSASPHRILQTRETVSWVSHVEATVFFMCFRRGDLWTFRNKSLPLVFTDGNAACWTDQNIDWWIKHPPVNELNNPSLYCRV